MNKLFSRLCLIYLIVWLGAMPINVWAIGVSPSTVEIDNMANGVDAVRSIRLSRSKSLGEEATFSVSVSGPGARFISLPASQITMKPGENAASIDIHIKPQAASNGQYRAEISFLESAPLNAGVAGAANSVSIISGAIATVIFTVVDREIKELKISSIEINDTEVGVPPTLAFAGINTGNVDARPDSIIMHLEDVTDPAHTFTDTITGEQIGFVRAAVSERVSVQMNKDIPLGNYRGSVNFMFGGQKIFEQTIKVRVWPAGTLAQTAEFNSFVVENNTYQPGELVKFTGSISNTGDLPFQAGWYLEIKQGNKTIDILRSDKKLVGRKNSSDYTLTWRPENSGQYSVEAYFEFGAKKTDAKQLSVSVASPISWLVIGLSIGAIIIISLIVILIVRHHRSSRPTFN